MKREFVCLAFAVSLVGLAWPSPARGEEVQAEDDVWLNELYTDFDASAEEALKFKVTFELVGRPKSTGADAPSQLDATLTFYSHNAALSPAVEVDAALVGESDDDWEGNYVFTSDAITGASGAFPIDDDCAGECIGGAVLSFTGGDAVAYCWGEDAEVDEAFGPSADEIKCQSVVRKTSMSVTEAGKPKGSALYGKADPPKGTKEGDFVWAVSICSDDADSNSLGTPNVCSADGACVSECGHSAQAMGDWDFTDTSQVWLNEIDYADDSLSVEVVGRPTAAVAPENMVVTLKFYAVDDGTLVQEEDITLVEDPAFENNYALTATYTDATDAFPNGGVVLEYGDVFVVYCWGTTGTIGGRECGRPIRSDAFSATSPNCALYGKTAEGTAGSGEKDFVWQPSTLDVGSGTADAFFKTIGALNECPGEDVLAGRTCEHHAQKLTEFGGEEETKTPEVWINEIYHLPDTGTHLEVVGRPSSSPLPEKLDCNVAFYLGDDEVTGAGGDIELVANHTHFEGNFAMSKFYGPGTGGAFPANGQGGVILTQGSDEVVYCWGVSSGTIDGKACTVVREGPFTADSPNSALYSDTSTPEEGGSAESHFTWEESVVPGSPNTPFHSIGLMNKCPDNEAACTLKAQILSPLGVPPDHNEVWLNELQVEGSDDPTLVVVGYEVAGRPVRDAGNPPVAMEVDLEFFTTANCQGSGGASIATEAVRLTAQESWSGNYMKAEEDKTNLGGAFPTAAVGGMRLSYDSKESRVYCWGVGAGVGVAIDCEDIKCQTVITGQNINIDDKSTNFALWNPAGDSTGGENAEYFVWALSESSEDGHFATFGSVNTCPDGKTCTTEDQVLSPLVWPSSTSTSTSSSTSGAAAHQCIMTLVTLIMGLTVVSLLLARA